MPHLIGFQIVATEDEKLELMGIDRALGQLVTNHRELKIQLHHAKASLQAALEALEASQELLEEKKEEIKKRGGALPGENWVFNPGQVFFQKIADAPAKP